MQEQNAAIEELRCTFKQDLEDIRAAAAGERESAVRLIKQEADLAQFNAMKMTKTQAESDRAHAFKESQRQAERDKKAAMQVLQNTSKQDLEDVRAAAASERKSLVRVIKQETDLAHFEALKITGIQAESDEEDF